MSDAQRLFGLGDLISVIQFKVDDIYQADRIAKELEQAAGTGFMATSWMEQNRALFRALRLEPSFHEKIHIDSGGYRALRAALAGVPVERALVGAAVPAVTALGQAQATLQSARAKLS